MPRSKDPPDHHFEGFENPTTTPVPDVVFDQFLSWLGEAELKALLYIIRRTFGFKKDRDPISFNQFLRGITTADGRALDKGCGVRSRTTLSAALRSLEAKGIVKSEKGVDERGENVTTVYSLRFKASGEGRGVVRNPYHRSTGNGLPVVRQTYPQETVRQQTVSQYSKDRLSDKKTNQSKPGGAGGIAHRSVPEQAGDRPPRPGLTQVGGIIRNRVRAERKQPSQETETGPQSAPHPRGGPQDHSAPTGSSEDPPGARRRSRKRPPRFEPWIVALVEQFSDEFHDSAHLTSNLTRTANLWKTSGLSEEAFRALMFDARTRTKKRGDITKRADGQAGQAGLTNRAPYFFACLEELLGLRVHPPQGPQSQQDRSTHDGPPKPPGDPSGYFAGPWGQALRRLQDEHTQADDP